MRSPVMGGGGGRGGETPQHTQRSASGGGGGGGGGREFFICFTARPSTSMRAPSARSLPSPGRNHRDPAAPLLSSSLSRRLRSSRSLKGGQSPMFPARKGSAFRAAEPSSPKVTCIGQVRVKSKAKKMGEGAALGSRSDGLRRREEGKNGIGEEERECSRNQSWVYQLPSSICEALRAVGSEFNCFLPCGKGRAPCFSSSKAREERRGEEGRGEKRSASSCGVVFARWLMAIEESEEGEGGKMVGLVVGERERENRGGKVEEVGKEGWMENKEEVMVVEEVVCVPPKNALLLMRCRSDPVKMAALTSRFFGSPATKVRAEEEEEEENDDGNEERKDVGKHLVAEEAGKGDGQESNDEVEVDEEKFSQETGEAETRDSECETMKAVILSVSVKEEGVSEDRGCVEKEKGIKEAGFLDESLLGDPNEVVEATQTELQEKQYEGILNDETISLKRGEKKEEEDIKGKEPSSCSSEYNKGKEENIVKKETEETRSNRFSSECNKEGIRRSSSCKEKERRRHSFSTEREARRHSFSTGRDARRASISVDKQGTICWSVIIDREEIKVRSEVSAAEAERDKKKEQFLEEEEIRKAEEVEKLKRAGEAGVVPEEIREEEEEEGGGEREEKEEEEKREGLPDCLLLMTYEPKLSMEVSRETWVCSTKFPHCHHHHHGHSPKGGRTRSSKGKAGVDSASDGRCVKVDKVGDGRCVESVEVIQSTESSPQHLPPPPPVPPFPSAVEETLLSGVAAALVPAFEPFVLTRCKSEPARPSARLVAGGGFWKNRHRPVDAIGF